MSEVRDAVDALKRIGFLLERSLAAGYKVQAFRKAAHLIEEMSDDKVRDAARRNALRKLPGIGEKTERVIVEALAGETPEYLKKLESEEQPVYETGGELRAALKGDCHTHSTWSDGGSPILEMARTARDLGHEYIVLTDHSPTLTVANGLTAERLLQQLDEVVGVNQSLAREADSGEPLLRVLTGIEVDILEDGSLDQDDSLLDHLDLVVGSVHSKLRMSAREMTPRMLEAIANPRLDILGHCTGRKVMGKGRPPSEFDAEKVFAACIERGVAVEINSRPERKDPPMALLRQAAEAGCIFSIDSDAHAPGQLDWLPIGCERATNAGISADRVINTRSSGELVQWTTSRILN